MATTTQKKNTKRKVKTPTTLSKNREKKTLIWYFAIQRAVNAIQLFFDPLRCPRTAENEIDSHEFVKHN